MREKVAAVLLALCILPVFGCMSSPNKIETAPSSASASEISSQSEPAPVQSEPSLYEWWSDYIYDAVYTLQSDYPSMVQYDSCAMVEYCGIRMFREGKITEAGKDADGNDRSILPKELLSEYMLRYFNTPLSDLDTLKLESDDGASILFYLPVGIEAPAGESPADQSLSNGPFKLTDAKSNEDGTVTLTVLRDDNLKTYFTMAPNQQGYYIKSVRQDWGKKSDAIQMTGKYITANTLLGMDGRHGIGYMYGQGEIDGHILLVDSEMNSSLLTLSLVSTTDLSETMHEIPLAKDETFLSAEADETQITVLTDKRIFTMGAGFSNQTEEPLPAAFIKLFPDGVPEFDVSKDRTKAVYSDNDGISLFDFTTGTKKLLAKHPNYNPNAQDDAILSWITYGNVKLINDDTQVLATIHGYENSRGQFIYDLETDKGTTFEVTYGWDALDLVIGDKAIAFQRENRDEDPNFAPNIWMDVKTGETHAFDLPPEIKYLLPAASGDQLLVMGDLGNRRWQLYRMNLDTMQLEKLDFSFSGEDPQMIAAGKNGSLLFVYYSFDGGTGEYILANAK
ncbi:hypothetical protein V6615_09180 [Oscillospiraceae bacterium PP1C4]